MDYFGYFAAAAPERYARERDELRQVLSVLQHRFGRRHLLRVADVADAVLVVRMGSAIEDFNRTPVIRAAADVAVTPRRVTVDLTEIDRVIE